MGGQQIEADLASCEKFASGASLRNLAANDDSRSHFHMPILNARAVEYIAKPGRTSELRKCIGTSVLHFLEAQTGFKGAFVLTPHKEPRLVLVFSFWEKEMDCRENQWECASEIQRVVAAVGRHFFSCPHLPGHISGGAGDNNATGRSATLLGVSSLERRQ
jgi:heme-degrading monooxygenase HmoA